MCLKYYKNLKKLREEKNLSIKQLSEITGISELIIKNIEEQLTTNHGINKISILSKALDVSIDDFINKEL
ncbi:helix-turn-helix transcriptional regulator [Clostridioides difficile]|uniref:helix-turn-helix domain-containing protein n=1 Tax=Clostridioides difficile TaxID=1496 RepID=UPI001266DB12|nr:helix-turn-helix transcriptional regulator [Clostridioides difficile]MDL5120614.1 helix-turn-helix transcriptional regulator [Clostridioides difficile]QFS33412.1 helix-turn-helix domain-containing protein [Clostridioides difficile]QIF80181.1 XRE family transcriptional regulator [Clostridioides difficile]